MAMNSCIHRKTYVSGDKLGVMCTNVEVFRTYYSSSIPKTGLRITNAMVCSDCKYRKPVKKAKA